MRNNTLDRFGSPHPRPCARPCARPRLRLCLRLRLRPRLRLQPSQHRHQTIIVDRARAHARATAFLERVDHYSAAGARIFSSRGRHLSVASLSRSTRLKAPRRAGAVGEGE